MIVKDPDQIAGIVSKHPEVRVLSVDLFDTLVFRETFVPEGAFHLQHVRLKAAGLHAGTAAAWVAMRKHHEHALARAAAPGEITLGAIYDAVGTVLGWSSGQAELAMALELEIESELIRPYPDVIAALADLERTGIAILVQTDTYLPATFIASLLDRQLPFPYALRCSSQTGAPKRSGMAYTCLRADFGASVIHLGDNRRVDVVLARKAGVKAWQVDWRRARMLRNTLQPRYAAALGLQRVRTPWDEGPGSAVAELAFRWSFVLADFMLALRERADAIGATDIWLLSRDCESIAAVVETAPHVLGERTVRYVECSRSSCHPILAATDPARFASWGYALTDDKVRAGKAAIAYYRSQLTPRSRKVLIVDTGWKGRLQVAIASALPEVEVHGFYFSLEPGAEPEALARSATFLRWDPRTFLQPVVEALAGFAATSCARFALTEDGHPVATRKPPSPDRSPQPYCDALRAHLAVLLDGQVPHALPSSTQRLALRREAVAQICAYPDACVIDAFRDWQIGIHADDADTGHLLSTGTASRIDRLLGRGVRGNLWPRAAVWSLTSRPQMVRGIHRLQDRLHQAKQGIKRITGSRATS